MKNQQAMLRQTLGNYNESQRNFQFPAGCIPGRQSISPLSAAAASVGSPAVIAGQWAPGVGNPGSSVRAYSNSGAGNRGRESPGKLATMVIAAVDEEFDALADPNMPDGSFNPALTLQQSAGYETVRQAKELERRINRGVVRAFSERSKAILGLPPVLHAQHSSSRRQCCMFGTWGVQRK